MLIAREGTVFVYDDTSRRTTGEQADARLKYDRSGPVPTILVPQPSDDPNDPLVKADCRLAIHQR